MYKTKQIGKNKYVGIAQMGSGWNVSTFSVNGKRVKLHDNKDKK